MSEAPDSVLDHDLRCPSGIDGFDEITGGGVPADYFYLIQGDPGSGKTTLALQFLLEGVRRGEKVFYITLSESKRELLKVARSHGWSLENVPLMELSAIEALLRPESQNTVFHTSEVELGKVSRLLKDELRRIRPARVVFDSLSEFRLMAETSLRYRRQLLILKEEFAAAGSTVLLLDDKMSNENIGADPHILSLAHGVVEMEQLSPNYGTSRRRLRVLKMRGVEFSEGYHDYTIVSGGLRIFPRLVAGEHRSDTGPEPVSSGLKPFDDLLGGGFDRGTTALIMGSAGTGKTTLALQYAAEMSKRGECAMVLTFDETLRVMLARAKQLGIDIEPGVQRDLVKIAQLDPAEISPGEFVDRIVRGVEDGCKLVVIDSLNGYLNAMPGEQYLMAQLHELTAYLNQQGVVTIIVMALHGLTASMSAPMDLSYLADTVVMLQHFEAAGEIKQAIAVVKKRSGAHEKAVREFKLETGRGIQIGAPLRQFRGILSGTPTFDGNADRMMKAGDAPQ
ncbi:MAG TPA: ATPase domain-containing protein [Verrucomicrobiae bacterium]|nr:ATPase domain-containing protein [Verrucomicrobiae bacterium]